MRQPRSHSTLAWVALALLGLVVAVGVSYAASQLSKPSVGLSSEPVPGVSELAPAAGTAKPHHRQPRNSPDQPAQTAPGQAPGPPTTANPAPASRERDDSGGEDD